MNNVRMAFARFLLAFVFSAGMFHQLKRLNETFLWMRVTLDDRQVPSFGRNAGKQCSETVMITGQSL